MLMGKKTKLRGEWDFLKSLALFIGVIFSKQTFGPTGPHRACHSQLHVCDANVPERKLRKHSVTTATQWLRGPCHSSPALVPSSLPFSVTSLWPDCTAVAAQAPSCGSLTFQTPCLPLLLFLGLHMKSHLSASKTVLNPFKKTSAMISKACKHTKTAALRFKSGALSKTFLK